MDLVGDLDLAGAPPKMFKMIHYHSKHENLEGKISPPNSHLLCDTLMHTKIVGTH